MPIIPSHAKVKLHRHVPEVFPFFKKIRAESNYSFFFFYSLGWTRGGNKYISLVSSNIKSSIKMLDSTQREKNIYYCAKAPNNYVTLASM